MKEIFNTFFNKWNGKPCEVNDPSNLNQCMDLAYAFCDALGVTRDTIRHLYASEIYTKPNDLTVKYFELIPNTPLFVPQAGDICVFKGGTAGHVSIAIGEGDTNSFKSFDQNFGATVNKCGIITHPYDNLLGVLRFRQVVVSPITDQTILPIIDAQGHNMEVQAVRSKLADDERRITNLLNSNDSYSAKVSELEDKLNESFMAYTELNGKLTQVKEIVFGRGWTWIKIANLKKLLA